MSNRIARLLDRARKEFDRDGAVSTFTQALLDEQGYMLSSLSRDLQCSRSY